MVANINHTSVQRGLYVNVAYVDGEKELVDLTLFNLLINRLY